MRAFLKSLDERGWMTTKKIGNGQKRLWNNGPKMSLMSVIRIAKALMIFSWLCLLRNSSKFIFVLLRNRNETRKNLKLQMFTSKFEEMKFMMIRPSTSSMLS